MGFQGRSLKDDDDMSPEQYARLLALLKGYNNERKESEKNERDTVK
jgi:hypothetical protein